MKKTLLLAYIALFITFLGPVLLRDRPAGEDEQPRRRPLPPQAPERRPLVPAAGAEAETAAAPAPETICLLLEGETVTLDMQEYLAGVLAAEMPASFEPEALKAQAVAARTYAMYCALGKKHGDAQVCADFACCQACWQRTSSGRTGGINMKPTWKKYSPPSRRRRESI